MCRPLLDLRVVRRLPRALCRREQLGGAVVGDLSKLRPRRRRYLRLGGADLLEALEAAQPARPRPPCARRRSESGARGRPLCVGRNNITTRADAFPMSARNLPARAQLNFESSALLLVAAVRAAISHKTRGLSTKTKMPTLLLIISASFATAFSVSSGTARDGSFSSGDICSPDTVSSSPPEWARSTLTRRPTRRRPTSRARGTSTRRSTAAPSPSTRRSPSSVARHPLLLHLHLGDAAADPRRPLRRARRRAAVSRAHRLERGRRRHHRHAPRHALANQLRVQVGRHPAVGLATHLAVVAHLVARRVVLCRCACCFSTCWVVRQRRRTLDRRDISDFAAGGRLGADSVGRTVLMVHAELVRRREAENRAAREAAERRDEVARWSGCRA